MEHAHIAALRGLALLGVRPLPLDNSLGVDQSFCSEVCRVRFLGGIERAKMLFATTGCADGRDVPAARYRHAEQSGAVLRIRADAVLGVDRRLHIAQVLKPVVGSISVDVVDLPTRPCAVCHRPCDSVGRVVAPCDFDDNVALAANRAGNVAGLDSPSTIGDTLPAEQTRCCAVLKALFEKLDFAHDLDPNQANERGEHEASIRSDVQTGLPDRRVVLRADHDSDSGRPVPIDPLQRGAGNVVRVSAACSGAGVQKPHADTVRAAELCAVHASGRGRFFNWISASSIESNRSIRSSWVGAGVCSLSHACGSVRASAMDARLCFGLGEFFGQLRVARLCDDPENTLSDPRREFVGPLVHRLVGDAHGLSGSGDGTAEDFNGL